MKTIFKYILRRMLLNKFYIGMVAVAALYSYQIISGDIIRGVAYTAPFSEWSYGAYMAKLLPLLLVTLLFFLISLYSPAEQRVQAITDATPVNQRQYLLLRCAAMLIGFLLMVSVAIIISLVFYNSVFGYTGFGAFIAPIVITVLPALLFTFGLGLVLGRAHPAAIYGLVLLLVVSTLVALPEALDISGVQFFMNTPLNLPVGADGEVAFAVPAGVAFGRVSMGLVGIALAMGGICLKPRAAK